ncbi:hypothetical protein FGO68_gene11183 [Halteria grandinella]|uniref:Uncharacterized protein n=1 Tax=Halteria grandinella TaxID=5974 RepID=A0A8J8P2L0_HALGN|nr:hypothetical protein FGO68_gene11183 [Halteria grandinella]
MTNFQCKLESYMKSESLALTQRDQDCFIAHNQVVIRQISEQVQGMTDQMMSSSTSKLKKAVGKPSQQVLINIQRNDTLLELKFKKTFLKSIVAEFSSLSLVSSGQYISISECQDSSQLYKIDNSNHLTHLLSLPFEVRLMAITDDRQIAINEQLYNLNDLAFQQNLQISIEKYISVYQKQNILYYGHVCYPWIMRVDYSLNKKRLLEGKPGKMKGAGVVQIEGVKGLQDQLIFLYKGVVRKFTVIPDSFSQQSEVVCQVTQELVQFKMLPDNIHLVAITANRQIFTADHFTGTIVQKIQTQERLSSIHVHPHFDFEQFPIILGNSQASLVGLDILESGIKIRNKLDGAQFIAQIDEGRFIIQEGGKLVLLQFN